MIAPEQLLTYIKAQPFRPFRLNMASGKSFEIRHPETLRVGKGFLLLFSFVIGQEDIIEKMESIAPMLVESISHLDLPVSK